MFICNTEYFKQLQKGEKYQAEQQETRSVCWKQIEMIAIRINWILQRFEKSDFIQQTA